MGNLVQQTQCPYSNDYFASKTYRLVEVVFFLISTPFFLIQILRNYLLNQI